MSDGTVRGTFDLNADPALRKLRALRTEGASTDRQMRQLGTTMDKVGGPSSTQRLNVYARKVRDVGTTADRTAARVSASWEAQEKAIDSRSRAIEERVDRVQQRVERYGRTRASARVDLDGVDRVNAQIIELERRLNRLGRQRSSPSVGLTGGFANAAGGGAGGGSSAVGGRGGGRLGLAAKLAIGGAALTPGIQALGVSSTALLGSAAGATLGAATVYGGGLATVGLGAGLTFAIAKPAVRELQDLARERARYTRVVEQYGRASRQAAVARDALRRAERHDTGADVALRQVELFTSQWRRETAPGRRALLEGVGNVTAAGRHALPVITRGANQSASAVSGAASSYARFLAGAQTGRTVMGLTSEFARDMPIVEQSLRNLTSTAEHLSLAARPFFHEGIQWVETWTHGLAASSSSEARVQHTMHGLVQETKDWARLGGATYRTLRDIFNMGRPSGDSMVVSLTHTLDRWDAWIQRNPAKVSRFFSEAQSTTEKIGSALTGIVHLLSQMATSLQPIFNRGMALVSLAGRLGPLGTTALSATAYGAYAGFRGGARGGSGPAGMVGTAVFGRPFVGGGARTGGGVVVGGAAAAVPATRFLVPKLGAVGSAPAAAGQMPLFATLGGQTVVNRGAQPTRSRLATPDEFRAAYGDVSGARYGMPASTLGERPSALRRFAGGARNTAVGAAKTVGITMALVSALEAGGKGGSASEVTQNFLSGLSFGLVKPVDPTGSRGAAWASRFTQGIPQTTSPLARQQILSRKISRDLAIPFEGEGMWSMHRYGGRQINPYGPDFLRQVGSQISALERMPGGHARNLVQEIKALRTAYQEAAEQARALKREQNAVLDARSVEKASRISSQLGGAYTYETQHGRSASTAFGDVTGNVLRRMRGMRQAGARVLAENTLAWARQMERDNPKLTGVTAQLTNDIRSQFRRLGRDIQIVNGHILTGSRSEWSSIKEAMASPIEAAKERMKTAFTAIQREAVGSLKAMGFSPSAAANLVGNIERGGSSASHANQAIEAHREGKAGRETFQMAASNKAAGRDHARGGGLIGGKGLLDTQRVPGGRAAPGEAWIANRHTLADISRATVREYGLTAQQMITGETRLHSKPFARGGLAGVRSGVRGVVERVLGRFGGLDVTSTTGGHHAANSLHYLDEAVDLSGPSAVMLRAAQWIGSTFGRELAEGIHNPNLSVHSGHVVPPSFWGAQTWAEHANHIHVGVLGGGGARGAAMGFSGAGAARKVHLHGRQSGLGGVPGVLADRGSLLFAAALQNRVNRRLARTAAPGTSVSMAGGGAPSANEALGKRMMLAAGWPVSEWPYLRALWTQESGWDANSVNSSSGAYGIPQALGHGHPFPLGRAGPQIAWGLNYIRGRYGSPQAAEAHERSYNWYQRGGHPRVSWAGWNAAGGEFETKGPTIFGAGERGKERVRITPLRQSHTGGHRIDVHIDHVTLRNGSVEDVERVAREVAGRILEELEGAGVSGSESELI